MTAFANLSALARAMFALWALLLLLLGSIVSTVLAATKKRILPAVLAALLFVPIYLLWQVIFDLSLFGSSADAARISVTLGALPWFLWLAALLLLGIAAALLLGRNLRYDKTNLTPGTVKLFLDKLPGGVCCWKENGRVLFANDCMNRLCARLTGAPLLSGNPFRNAVADGILPVDGTMWRFSCREFLLDGEKLYEMIASNITAEYAKTQALERDKAELSLLNRELQDYYRSIDDVVRGQEVLQARVSIHDEMNRLMLSTMAASNENPAALDRIFRLWEQNALLLGREAEEEKDDSLEQLALALDIRLIWQSSLPPTLSPARRSLFLAAAREALINAVKHARAKTMTISFEEAEDRIFCRFANDGAVPSSPVRFTGGLANLLALADKQGAFVSVCCADGFTLSLCFPKSREENQPIG